MKNKSIVIITYLLFFNKIAAASEGMPQLNPEFWLSQILWLTGIFIILYFLVQKFFSPKLFSLIDARADFIKSLLKEAEIYKNQIQKLENEYNLIIAEAKNESKKLSAKLKSDFNEKTSLKKKEFEIILNSETQKAEQEINTFRKQTLENIQNIAGDFSKELIEKITGTAPNSSNLNAVITEISNKEKKNQYV
jgi:F-type H+-transporting ATPase subunit b